MTGRPPKIRHPERLGLHVRVVLPTGIVMGPGRADLLQHIQVLGSISAAGRAMEMSYRRAWLLVDAMSREFGAPVVLAAPGGAHGGGASLTPLGADVLKLYRQIEAEADKAAAGEVAKLQALIRAPGQ